MNERFEISKLQDYNMVLHCTNAELYARIESMFTPGMSWSNYGTEEGQWTVKYIIPLYHFHDYGIPLTVHTTDGPVHITMEDMCTCVNVHPVWNNQKDRTPTHDEVIKKCIEISQYLSKKQIVNFRKRKSNFAKFARISRNFLGISSKSHGFRKERC